MANNLHFSSPMGWRKQLWKRLGNSLLFIGLIRMWWLVVKSYLILLMFQMMNGLLGWVGGWLFWMKGSGKIKLIWMGNIGLGWSRVLMDILLNFNMMMNILLLVAIINISKQLQLKFMELNYEKTILYELQKLFIFMIIIYYKNYFFIII